MTIRQTDSGEVRAVLGALMSEFFSCVSFTVGQRPAYGGIRALFVDNGLLIRNTSDLPEVSTVNEFVVSRQSLFDEGGLTEFEERELGSRTEVFGRVAHRLSGYSKQGCRNGVPFEACGVITTQFVLTPTGWHLTSMAWDDARPGLSIPAELL
jgi:hypothetical protein